MNRTILRLGTVLAGAALLGGCSVMRSLGFRSAGKSQADLAAASQVRPVPQIAPVDATRVKLTAQPAASLTDIGRSQLDAGNPGLAIETFGKALMSGEPRAPILNGLGVGHARIGRADIAAHYFRRAMAIAPDDGRYAANLAKLLAAQGFDRQAEQRALADASRLAPESVPAAMTRQPGAAPAVAASGIRPAAPTLGKLERVAAREYVIRTLPAAGQPAQASRMAMRQGGFRPAVRATLAPRTKAAAATDRRKSR